MKKELKLEDIKDAINKIRSKEYVAKFLLYDGNYYSVNELLQKLDQIDPYDPNKDYKKELDND